MGEIVGAALLAHVPTMVLPVETRYELNEGKEISLVPGLHRFRSEVMDQLDIDTVLVFDSHWFTTVEFIVTSHERRLGRYTSGELPRGMSQVPYDIPGDPQLARAIAATSAGRDDAWITAIDDECLPIEYPTVNLLGFLQGDEAWVSFSCAQTGEYRDFMLTGQLVGDAIRASDRKVFLIASGAMSHTFHSLSTLRAHESSDPSHIFSPAARAMDEQILGWWSEGDHRRVLDSYPEFLQHKPEARFGHYLMMVAALGGAECTARGVLFSDYENSIGTGQVHVNFEL